MLACACSEELLCEACSRLKMRDAQFSSKAYGTREYKEISIDGRIQFDLLVALQVSCRHLALCSLLRLPLPSRQNFIYASVDLRAEDFAMDHRGGLSRQQRSD